MSEPWFHVEHVPEAGESIALDGREAKHAAGSRRLAAGDAVRLFDGRGALALAAISRSRGHDGAVVVTVRVREVIAPPSPSLHLAAALPKGDRAATMLSMSAALGMSTFTPLLTEHAVTTVGRNAADRWNRVMVEACKQSRRAHLPRIESAKAPVQVVSDAAAASHFAIVAHPGGAPLIRVLNEWLSDHITLLAGPEGGFAESEVADMRTAGADIVSLGDGILRIETAVVSLLAAAGMVHAARRTRG